MCLMLTSAFSLPGWLRDLTGSYTVSFLTAGAFLLASSLILATFPNYFSCSRPSEAEEEGARRPPGHNVSELSHQDGELVQLEAKASQPALGEK